MTVCAERNAVFQAVLAGERRFKRIAVVADKKRLTAPCGACRQILWEFCGDIEVILANLQGRARVRRMGKLLPFPFDSRQL
ncbi:MAG: cytidine deaminase [Terriglobia bacterium]